VLAASGPVTWRHAKWSWLSLAKMGRWGDLTKFQSPEHRGNQRKCTETISASKLHGYIATNFSFVSSIPHVLVEYRRQNSPTILQHFGFCRQNSSTSLQSFGFCKWQQVQWVHLSPNKAFRRCMPQEMNSTWRILSPKSGFVIWNPSKLHSAWHGGNL